MDSSTLRLSESTRFRALYRSLVILIITVLLCSFIISTNTFTRAAISADDLDIEAIAQIGGEVGAVAVQGSYAYLGVGSRLVVLNISNVR